MMRRAALKALVATISSLCALVIGAAVIEAWARITWNPRRGSPGLYLLDPVRRQRLAPNYRGWFAGVRVEINSLGLRDPREYRLEKPSDTFRILVLGDSVTFGHGSVYEHTYPYMVEQMLKQWRPDVRWEIWNAAEPGYNTSQELAQLYEVGPVYKPDLVIVGFYGNDLIDNQPIEPATAGRRWMVAALNMTRRHLYSFDLYRRIALQTAWAFVGSDAFKQRLDAVASEEALFSDFNTVEQRPEQQVTPLDRLTDEQVSALECRSVMTLEGMEAELRNVPGWDEWLSAVRAFQDLNRRGVYRIAFFINPLVRRCKDGGDYFDPVGPGYENAVFTRLLSDGTPAGSAFNEFMHYRPTQMPYADGHTVGNSNLVKAQALFAFLRDSVFPSIPDLDHDWK
jgi:hypothetical protein